MFPSTQSHRFGYLLCHLPSDVIGLNGVGAVRLDSFETTPPRWMLMTGENAEVDFHQDFVGDDHFSPGVTYTPKRDKLLALVMSLRKAPIQGATKLRLSLLSRSATTALVGLKEKDGVE